MDILPWKIRVGFCGAGGTGKGSVMKIIAEEYFLKPIPSMVQYIGQLLFPETKSYREIRYMPSKDRWIYQYSALIGQIQAERMESEGFVAERSIFDFLAYVRDMPLDEYNLYFNLVMRAYYRQPYDILFYVPIGSFEPQDGEIASWKERDQKEREQTDKFLKNLIFHSATKSRIVILKGNLEERVSLASEAIKQWRKNFLSSFAAPISPSLQAS